MRDKRRICTLAVALCLGLTMGYCASAAEPAVTNAHVPVWRGDVWVDSTRAAFHTEEGVGYEMFSYQGTVYIPLRTAGEWMGKQAVWHSDTMTVALSGTGEGEVFPYEEIPHRQATEEELKASEDRYENGIDIQIRSDIKVLVDGVEQRFVNVNGKTVYPAVFQNTVYLPVRSIGTLMGMDAAYFRAPGTVGDGDVFLRSPWKAGEQDALSAFLDRSLEPLRTLSGSVLWLEGPEDTREQRAGEAQAALEQLQGIAWPQSDFAAYRLERIRTFLAAAEEQVETYLSAPSEKDYRRAVSACQDVVSEYQLLVECFRQDWTAANTWLGF